MLFRSVTDFYRDPKACDVLRDLIRQMVANRSPLTPLRIWNVGCATGEEVYTVAMMFAEAMGGPAQLGNGMIQFFATDIDVDALAKAVKVTMGPSGQNVIIEMPGAPPIVTKDGVTVARAINFRDRNMNLGAQIIKEAADRKSTRLNSSHSQQSRMPSSA